MGPFDESKYLVDMYRDGYFPNFLVDKVKELLQQLVSYLESGEHTTEEIQVRLDQAIDGINDLEESFDENGSELETVARESIGDTVFLILKHYGIEIDIETAIRNRNW